MELIKEKNIGSFILTSFVGMITILILTMGILYWRQQQRQFSNTISEREQQYLEEQRNTLRSRANRGLKYIEHQHENIQELMNNYIRGRVYEGYQIAERIYQRYKDSVPEEEIKQYIHDALYAVRWNNGEGYYFVFDRRGTMWVHANNPELEQQNVVALEDEHGSLIVQEMLEIVHQQNEGHAAYYWKKPGSTNVAYKQSYVKLFEQYDWIIGAGIYLDMVEEHVQQQTIKWLRNIRFTNGGYFTIIDYDGNPIMTPAWPDESTTNSYTPGMTDRATVIASFISKGRQAGGGYTQHRWPRPGGKETAEKLSYSASFERWGWIITTGVYLDDFDVIIRQEEQKQKQRLYRQAKGTLTVFCGFGSVGLLLSILISRFISRRITTYQTALSEKARNLELLHQFDRTILSLDFKQTIEKAVDFISSRFGIDRVSVSLFSDDMSRIRIHTVRQEGTALEVGEEIALEETPLLRFKKKPIPIYRADLNMVSGRYTIEDTLRKEGYRSTFMVPLIMEEECIGTLNLATTAPNSFSVELRRLLELMAGRLAQILHNARLYAQQYESKQMLETVMDTIPQGIFWKDMNSVYVGCNRNFARVAGLKEPEEIIGTTDYGLNWSAEDAQYFQADDQRVIESNRPEYHMIEAQRSPAGEIIWRDVSKVPIHDREGAVIGVLGMYEDITERKQIREDRERLFTAVEQAAEAIMITDTAATIQYVNPAFETITGYKKAEVIGNNANILKSGEQSPEFYQEMWQTLQGKETWYGQLVNRRKDGSFYEEETAISPIKDHRGSVISYVAVKRDITEQAALQKELRQAQKMEAIGTLAGGIAHDFNNILMALMGYTDLALEEVEPGSRIEQYLTEVLKAGQRAKTLVAQILTFSRRGEEDRQPLHIPELIREVKKMVQATTPEGITIEAVTDPGTVMVLGDPAQLHQVVLNIIRNAVQAIQGGKGTVSISCETKEVTAEEARGFQKLKAGLYALVRVRDTGIGIPGSVVERIYEPFF